MRKYVVFSYLILGCMAPGIVLAEAGYIGENPGFDFYSKIDSGTYKIQQKLVSQKIRKNSNFSAFGRKCKNINLIGDAPVDERVLEALEKQNYGPMNALLKGKSVSADQFQTLTTCLVQEYKYLKADVAKEQDARETVAAIGLYADGDKSNSDYDIMYDIEKINQIIFSTEIKYSGTKNSSSKSLASLLAGNSPPRLLSGTAALIPPNTGNSGSGATGSGNTNSSPTLDSLLGNTCTNSGISGPLDTNIDETFVQELSSTINGNAPNTTTTTSGYSASNTVNNSSSGGTKKTSASDFFNKMPCPPGTMFCIDVKTIPGGNITLGGGKSVSIESIVDNFTQHLLPISESSLAYQKMTNNAGSFPIKNLNLWKSIGGLRIYMGNQPQPTRRDKTEQTPSRDEAELKAIIDCGYITAGLPTNMAQANSVAGAGYAGRGSNTNDKNLDVRPIGVVEAVSTAKLSGCMNEYMRQGRQTYYNSLSTDLTEIQAFTMSMIQEIRDIISILEPMNDKPVK